MRNKLRIKICINKFKRDLILIHFLDTIDKTIVNNIFNNWNLIEKEWSSNPDYRFGQLLSNLNLVPREIEDHIWNIEETDWLIRNKYINVEDIEFWGINFYQNGNRRKKVKYVLLKDLQTNHIQNIIRYFEDRSALRRIPVRYLEYFEKRINEIN